MARELEPDYHPYVFRVTLIRDAWTNVFLKVVSWLPFALQTIVRTTWPVYFLPDVVILKKLKPDWDDEFQNEINMYERLGSLQGQLIPIYYGEARCEGTRALILSEVLGVNSIEQKNPPLNWREFHRRLKVACEELARYGVVMDDHNISNVFLVDDRVMFVDLEMCNEQKPEILEQLAGWSVDGFRSQYASYLRDMEENPFW